MKIISWNLRNLGNRKLSKIFAQKYVGFGLGNDVGDFVARFVTGANCWNAIPNCTTNPADVFVVIELMSGGNAKGANVSGTSLPTMNTLVARLNTLMNANQPPGNTNPNYQYNFVQPLVIGYHEAVGIIYNFRRLNYVSSSVQRNNNTGNWILPRSAFTTQFSAVGNPANTINIAGLHAPPPGGSRGQFTYYRKPIDYSNLLYTTLVANGANTFFMGDFNLDPTYRYINGYGNSVAPFANLGAYSTLLPNLTRSSVRKKPNTIDPPPNNYLSDCLDNIIFNAPLVPGNTHQIVADLIGQARNMNAFGQPNVSVTNVRLLVNAYNFVSDHMPVVIEF